MTKSRRTSSRRRGQPRRRVVPLWRRRSTIASVAGVALIAVTVAAGWLWREGHVARAADQLRWKAIAATAAVGFRINEVLVVGRDQTPREDLLKAVRLARGAPILAFDPAAAKERIEALPWVRGASVERLLPDTVLLRIEERRALALWQHKGRFALIDTRGEVILEQGLERFADLLVVVGPDAPANAPQLLADLSTQPQLLDKVKAAVRIGGRRWNVQLKGGIDIRLPEEDAVGAWARLAEYETIHRVLDRDVGVLDLRLPDRLTVRKTKRPPKSKPGRET